LQARHGVDQDLRQGQQRGQALAQPSDQGFDPPQVGRTGTFRTIAQLFAALHGITFLQRLQQQAGMADHSFTGRMAGRLVVLEPLAQLARRQPLSCQRLQQTLGMPGVGARQRRQDATGRPARQLTGTHRGQHAIG
jgi:hypothetical protein